MSSGDRCDKSVSDDVEPSSGQQCPLGYDAGARVAGATNMAYGDYLALDQILEAQRPLSPDHNEMLFIIQHQTAELWMKLAIHELSAAVVAIPEGRLSETKKMLARVTRVFEQLLNSWSVLATLTPTEYAAIREFLGESSGFQSWQYRQIEFLLGNKNAAMVSAHAGRPQRQQAVIQALESKSIYDEVLAMGSRSGLAVPGEVLQRDWREPYQAHDGVVEMWNVVYQDPEKHWDMYYLGEKLVDLEDIFRQWRFRHLTTVQRIIGSKIGTGGTSGVGYLRSMLDVVLFPELWTVRSLI